MTASKQPTDALTERLESIARLSHEAPAFAALARAVIELRAALYQGGYEAIYAGIDAELSKGLGL